MRRSGWTRVSRGFWGELDDLMQEKKKESIMIEVRPEGYIGGPGSDI